MKGLKGTRKAFLPFSLSRRMHPKTPHDEKHISGHFQLLRLLSIIIEAPTDAQCAYTFSLWLLIFSKFMT